MSTNNATLFQIRLTLLLLILLLCALCCGLCLAFSGAVSNWCEDSGCCTEYEGCWCGKHFMYMTFICCCLSVTRVRDTYVRWSGLRRSLQTLYTTRQSSADILKIYLFHWMPVDAHIGRQCKWRWSRATMYSKHDDGKECGGGRSDWNYLKTVVALEAFREYFWM